MLVTLPHIKKKLKKKKKTAHECFGNRIDTNIQSTRSSWLFLFQNLKSNLISK